jgi:plastocyanin
MLRTRTRALAVATAAALVLAACGDGDDGETVDDAPEDTTTDEVEDTDDDADAPEDDADAPEDDADAPDEDADTDGDAGGDGEVLAVTGTDDLTWDPDELEASAGTVEFELTCGAAMHDLVIDETGDEVAECMPDETVNGEVELEAGDYTYICTVPGHDRMVGTLTVS